MLHDQVRMKQVAELFDAVLELDEMAREHWLQQHCDNAEIRNEVLALCRADGEAQGILDSPDGSLAGALLEQLADPVSAMPGTRIGAWKITDLLGEGGMATVWLGERCDGRYEQQVAIKCLKTLLAGPELSQRFERERQILANLEHPGIARLLDGGVSDDGVPYMVMERVRGESLIKACDKRGLNLDQRLHLFADICDSVQYAHQHLIVHRDLKPANILIDEQGRPHLLDFGIASLLDEASGHSIPTRGFALTPEYAAPEQLKGKPVGVAADVYALGVILCEMLTGGQRPAVATDADPSSDTGQWPSRLVFADGQHAAWARQRARKLRGDLDTIVLKCLRQQPDQRYASAAHLAWDVRNHLMHRPIAARRGRFSYRALLFARRHRAGLAAAAIVLAVLMTALVHSIHQTRRAEVALSESRAVQGFLLDLFENNVPTGAVSTLPDTRELLDRGAQRARTGFPGNPQLRTRMLATIGGIYRRLGQFDDARKLLDEAVSAGKPEATGSDFTQEFEIRHELALLKSDQGQFVEAASMLEDILAERRRLGARGKPLAAALRELGRVRSEQGQHANAIALLSEAVAELQNSDDTTLAELADARSDLGEVLLRSDDYTQAIPILRIALEEKTRAYGSVHGQVNTTASTLAAALRHAQRYEEAGRLLRDVVESDARIFQTPHPDVAQHLNNLGTVLDLAWHPLEARDNLQKAQAMYRELFGQNHPQTAIATSNLADVENKIGHYAVAEPLQREVLKQFLASYGANHYNVAVAQNNLARSLADLGQWHEARQLAEASMKLKQKLRGDSDRSIAPALATLAQIERQTGRLDAARSNLEQVLQLETAGQSSDSPKVLAYRTDLAEVLCLESQQTEALAMLDTVLGNPELAESRAPLQRARTLSVQGDCLERDAHVGEAKAVWREALKLRKDRLPDDFPDSRRISEKIAAA